MRKLVWILCFYMCSLAAQQHPTDSISLIITLNPKEQTLHVTQKIKLAGQDSLDYTYLNAWANAYQGPKTPLSKTKLEDRKDQLYFAKEEQRGHIDSLRITTIHGKPLVYEKIENEFLKIHFPAGTPKEMLAKYTVKIPSDFVTGYGVSNQQHFLLKHFLLQPAAYNTDGFTLRHYRDLNTLTQNRTHYTLKANYPATYVLFTPLEKSRNGLYAGFTTNLFELYFAPRDSPKYYQPSSAEVIIGYEIPPDETAIVDSLIPTHLDFLEKKIGIKPNKMFLSSKLAKEQNFFGVDNWDVPILGEYQMFSPNVRIALKLFQQISHEYVDQLFIDDAQHSHWIKNGMATYLQMLYIEEEFPELLASGNISEDVKLLTLYPLKAFKASKIKMSERYRFLYLFMLRNNFDQPIATPYDELSNLNQITVSAFKTGLGFRYLSDYLPENEWNKLLLKFCKQEYTHEIKGKDFVSFIKKNATKDVSWFFDDFLYDDKKINLTLKKFKRSEDSIQIKIKNKTQFKGPFKVTAFQGNTPVHEQWFQNDNKKFYVNFPSGEYNKLVLNADHHLPEFNERDNYLITQGLFSNRKKISLKLFTDVEDPEYNQIFFQPQFRWNNYDKFLLGMEFSNRTFLARPFRYNIAPRFSTGEGQLTGAASVRYNFFPDKGWFRSVSLRNSFNYAHYDVDLSFLTWASGVSFDIRQNPRSLKRRSVSFSYGQVKRELAPTATLEEQELADYHLINASYNYWNTNKIHETQLFLNVQSSNKFQKAVGEFYWRWQYSKTRRLGVRVFGGMFLDYNVENSSFFDFGLDRITDYTFSYPLLGRSEERGLLSQQFVLAEGGFKSNFFVRANDYMLTTNLEFPVWKMFDLYADAGIFKNKNQPMDFVYDSGVRVRVIPDFLELYLPLQSSLGFEPGLPNYGERIRFMFNFDIGKVISYWRRGRF